MPRDKRVRKRGLWRSPVEPIKMTIRAKNGVERPAFIIDENTRCWNSTGPSTGNGYYRTSNKPAHRDAYERLYGAIPAGFECHHVCENPRCVNAAEHIIALSKQDHAKLHAFLRTRRLADGRTHQAS